MHLPLCHRNTGGELNSQMMGVIKKAVGVIV